MSKNRIKKPEPIRSLIFRRTYETAVREGLIDPQGKTEEEVWSDFEALYALWVKSNIEFSPILDHRSELLTQARHFASLGKYLLSCLFYATWVEHWFNGLIVSQAKRKKLGEDEIVQIIREVPLRGKLTWLLRLFDLKPLHLPHRNNIMRVADLRNGFVHYKWKPMPDEDDRRENELGKKRVEAIEKTVAYLNRYERKYIFKARKRAVHKVAVKKATEVENRR